MHKDGVLSVPDPRAEQASLPESQVHRENDDPLQRVHIKWLEIATCWRCGRGPPLRDWRGVGAGGKSDLVDLVFEKREMEACNFLAFDLRFVVALLLWDRVYDQRSAEVEATVVGILEAALPSFNFANHEYVRRYKRKRGRVFEGATQDLETYKGQCQAACTRAANAAPFGLVPSSSSKRLARLPEQRLVGQGRHKRRTSLQAGLRGR